MSETPPPSDTGTGRRDPLADDKTLLSSDRTELAFDRTRMAADRTMMAVVRTSLSLIGFGFTIAQFFNKLKQFGPTHSLLPEEAPRNFGLSLVFLGVGMLALGIWAQVAFLRELNVRKAPLRQAGLMARLERYHVSLATVVAVVLLVIGLLAIVSMTLRAGPFS